VPGEQPKYFVHESAYVDDGAQVGDGTKVWHFGHVMGGAVLGENCNLGQNVHIAGDVGLGSNVKIQNNVSIYTGTIVEDDVFLGPSCVFTNVTNPRSAVARQQLYERTLVRRGATVGANATVVCGIEIGRHAFIAAGAVVTRDVPDYALMVGAPARNDGWMSRHGHRLLDSTADGIMTCPESGLRYQEVEPGVLRCLDLDEDAQLPVELAVGTITHEEFKRRQEDS
jgi:UDP-2-acetamido-3-amino-2,3-dideoxy-glucuronate N-acetyltransferase